MTALLAAAAAAADDDDDDADDADNGAKAAFQLKCCFVFASSANAV